MRLSPIPSVFLAALVSASCINYRIHVQVQPKDVYSVKINDVDDKGSTDSSGNKDITLPKTMGVENPKVSVENKKLSGYAVLDPYVPMVASRNVDSLAVNTSSDGYRNYYIRFLLNKPKPLALRDSLVDTVGRKKPVEEQISQIQKPSAQPRNGEAKAFEESRRTLRGINDNPAYARKLAATGSVFFFIGMGLGYAANFLPVSLVTVDSSSSYGAATYDTTYNIGGALLVLAAGAASQAMEIAGTSYAIGGAKLSWELGEGKCEASSHPFDLWGAYKGGWIFTALGGIYGAISSFVPRTDPSTALTMSLIGLGLSVGRDVCWTISNVKALSMTKHVKECLEEQKTPAHHLRLELNPYATRSGGGVRCSLIFLGKS